MFFRTTNRRVSRPSRLPLVGLAGLTFLAFGGRLLKPAVRAWLHDTARTFGDRLLSDPYKENLWEFVSATARTGPQHIVETGLRAETGTLIERPLGSVRRWPNFDQLVFDVAQLAHEPTAHDQNVNLGVTIGPAAARPLRIDLPLIVSGMAYGLAVTKAVKIALAKGAALAGTASNSGEGPWLAMERQAARKFIMQFNRATWGKQAHALRRADMIEIQFGQGSAAGVGKEVVSARTDPQLRALLGIAPGQAAIIYARHPELRDKSLSQLVASLRELTGGVPIGVKLAPGGHLEEDLQLCLEAKLDVIALDGAKAATKGSPPILQDDFGLPTLHALVRAVDFLNRSGQRTTVSLIVGGGLSTPGDFLKALALGADAVYIGTMALFAVSHGQVFKSLPWEPPTTIVFQGGKQADRFDIDEGADRLSRYLRACAAEMAVALRALGKTTLADLSTNDLLALDEQTAKICAVPVTYRRRT